MVFGAVRVAMEVLDQPVIYVIWDVHLVEFIEQCWVSDSVEGFAEVQRNEDDKLVGGEEVGDGVQYGDENKDNKENKDCVANKDCHVVDLLLN